MRIRRSRISTIVGNPKLAIKTVTRIGTRIQPSLANLIMLSLYNANPALLNDEIAWKTPWARASFNSYLYSVAKRQVKIPERITWKNSMIFKMLRSKLFTSGAVEPVSEVALSLVLKDTRPSRRIATREAKPTIPKPPTWINTAITTCPKRLQ